MNQWSRTYYSFARFAFRDALALCQIKHGDVVLMPSFICRDVLAPVLEIGGIIEFYDVTRTLRPVISEISVIPKVILAVNYFGFPQQLGEIQQFASACGAIVIEDNAHGYLSQDSSGNDLGRRTDIGFTSFRKTLRVVNGAFLDTNLNRFPEAARLSAQTQQPSRSRQPFGHIIRKVVSGAENTTGLHLMNGSRAAIRALRQLAGRPTIPASKESEHTMPGDSIIHFSSLVALNSIDVNHERQRRIERYHVIAQRLQDTNYPLVFETLPNGVVPWGVPFFAQHQQLGAARRAIRNLGAEIISWPDLPLSIHQRHPEFYNQVHLVSLMK